MKIKNNISKSHPNFGIKVPIKTAVETASGRFLDNAKISYPRQTKLLSLLGNIDSTKLYTGEMAEGMRNMSLVIRKRYPEIAQAAKRISDFCDAYNMERTFLPEDEAIFCTKLKKEVNKETKALGIKEIDIEPISLKELGLDKYENI